MANKILIPLQSLVSCFLKPPVNRWAAEGATEGLWLGFLPTVSRGLHCLLRSGVQLLPEQVRVLLSLISFVPRIGPMKTVSTGQVFSRFSDRLWRGFLGTFSPLLFPPILSSSLHLCYCLQSVGQVIIFPLPKVVFKTVCVRLGLKPTWKGFCAMLSHSVVSNWDLSLAKTHGAWFQDLMMLRLLMSHCKEKFSERHSNR